MIGFNVKSDFSGALKYLENVNKQTRFATAVALTRTASDGRKDVQSEMKSVFDRPTPFTTRSVKFKGATKDNLAALVYIEGADKLGGNVDYSPADLLLHEFAGGHRKPKRLEVYLRQRGLISGNEYVVPGAGAKIDRYGNMSRGQVQQVLSQLRIGIDPQTYASKSKRSKANVRKAGRIFWSRGGRLPRGAWIDLGPPNGVRPLLVVVNTPSYRQRVDMKKVVTRTVNRAYRKHFDVALKQALR